MERYCCSRAAINGFHFEDTMEGHTIVLTTSYDLNKKDHNQYGLLGCSAKLVGRIHAAADVLQNISYGRRKKRTYGGQRDDHASEYCKPLDVGHTESMPYFLHACVPGSSLLKRAMCKPGTAESGNASVQSAYNNKFWMRRMRGGWHTRSSGTQNINHISVKRKQVTRITWV